MTIHQHLSAALVLLTLSLGCAFVPINSWCDRTCRTEGNLVVLSQAAPKTTRLSSTQPNSDTQQDTTRRDLLSQTARAVAVTTTASAVLPKQNAWALNPKSRTKGYDVQKSEAEWQSILSTAQYDVLRQGGTERPYSSILEGEDRPGTFVCAGCGTKLFDSKQKFHSGTGWPSFARGLEDVEVEDVNAVTANLIGAELRCKTCGGHLGDVFADGMLFPGTPAFTSGKRYCIDGAALVFQPANGEPDVVGDKTPPSTEPSVLSWLEPPKITSRSE